MNSLPERPSGEAGAGRPAPEAEPAEGEARTRPGQAASPAETGPGSRGAPPLPDVVRNEAELEELLCRPRPTLVDFMRTVSSPLVVLGAGGKMGPTLAVLAKRAAQMAGYPLEVIAVSRFSDETPRRWLEAHGVSTWPADLLERGAVQGLPEAAHVVYLVGLKFGTRQNPGLTWAINTLVPAYVAERYARARLVVLSTGNVYPLVPVGRAGASESHGLTPLGEYANAAVARERIFGHFAQRLGTPMAFLRLSYAVELRYGVLVDIARKVWGGEPIELANGCFNCIWQGDANEMILRALALATSPAEAWNLTSPQVLRVREVAEQLGTLFGRAPRFIGQESNTALLSDVSKLSAVLGEPATSLAAVLRWTAHWVQHGGRSLDKPTHFEVRDGYF